MATIHRDGIDSQKLVGLAPAYAQSVAQMGLHELKLLNFFSPNRKNLNTPDGMVPGGQMTYTYKEKQYNSMQTTVNGAVLAAATSITLTDKVCRPGDVIIVGDEAILLGASADYLTFACTKGYFTGTDAAIADGDIALVFGTSWKEGSSAPTAGPITQTSEVTTYTNILLDKVRVTGSAEYMAQYAEGNASKILEYTAETALNLFHQLEHRMVWSDAQAPTGEDGNAGRFDGIFERVAATNYDDLSSDDIAYGDLQKAVRSCGRKGGRPNFLAVSDYQSHQMDTWVSSRKQEASSVAQSIFGDYVVGIRVGDVLLDMIVTPKMMKNALVGTRENIRIGPKDASRELHPELLGKTGDSNEVMLVGEYTEEVALAYSHYWMKSVKFAA